MRLTAALAVLLLAPPVEAARIGGHIVHPTKPGATAGLPVRLLGVDREGKTVARETTSDAEGRFAFEDVGAGAVYLVMADYDGIRFPGGREVIQPGEANASREVVFHVYERTADPSALTVRSQRFFVERGDAGTYRVTQTLTAHNPSNEVVRVPEGAAAALHASLFARHGPVETRFGGLPEGARVKGDDLELRGPFFPGDDELIVAYEVDVGDRDLHETLRFPSGAEEIEFWVHDQGVDIDAGPLHPARASRTEDGFYQRFLGFDLAPGTEIPFSLVARPHPGPGALWPQVALAVVLSLALAYAVGAPITRAGPAGETLEESTAGGEKRALFGALHDLEHDFETGKLSQTDHDRLREELRSDALRSLARLEPELESGAKPLVCGCGHVAQLDDRFCAACGTAL